ncbi:unnamed protein product [Commensalibacter communis]|uniref:hypothetical protein n=1 Tax=Commensalibacter communis TaxID=2972786 RepID=UPI0022FFBAA0|nr:hypothetical protein [Commensalibacter communis]CAI3943539.1 unnamed protein product [Commensalibacter communis]
MKTKAIFTFFLYLLFLPSSYAENCKDMIGTYRVIPFIDPVGLTVLSADQISKSPIGTPIFEIKINNNNIAQHIGLIHRKHFPITLQPADENITTDADILFNSHISSCSYDFDSKHSITQVDLTTLNEQQINQALTRIIHTWFSRLASPKRTVTR